MNVKWLIENNVFSESITKDITSALDTIGVNYNLIADINEETNNANLFYIPYGSN